MQTTNEFNQSKVVPIIPLKIPKFALDLRNKLPDCFYFQETQQLASPISRQGIKSPKNMLTRCLSSGNIFSDETSTPKSPNVNEALLRFTRLRHELFSSKLATEDSQNFQHGDQFIYDPTTARSKSLSVERYQSPKAHSEMMKHQLLSTFQTEISSQFSPRDSIAKFQNSPKVTLIEDQSLLNKYRLSKNHKRIGSVADFINQLNQESENEFEKPHSKGYPVHNPLLGRTANYQTIAQLKKNYKPIIRRDTKNTAAELKSKDSKLFRNLHKSFKISKDLQKIDQNSPKVPAKNSSKIDIPTLKLESAESYQHFTFSLEQDKNQSPINKGAHGDINVKLNQENSSKFLHRKAQSSLNLRAKNKQADYFRDGNSIPTPLPSSCRKQKKFLLDPKIEILNTPRQNYSIASPKFKFSPEKNKAVKALHKIETVKISEKIITSPNKRTQPSKLPSSAVRNECVNNSCSKQKGNSRVDHKTQGNVVTGKEQRCFTSLNSLRKNLIENNDSPPRKASSEEYGLNPIILSQASKSSNTRTRTKLQELQANPEKHVISSKKLSIDSGKFLKPAEKESYHVENYFRDQKVLILDAQIANDRLDSQLEVNERLVEEEEEFVLDSQTYFQDDNKIVSDEINTFISSEFARKSKKEVSKAFGNPSNDDQNGIEIESSTIIDKEITIEFLDPMISVQGFNEEFNEENTESVIFTYDISRTQINNNNAVEKNLQHFFQKAESERMVNQEMKNKEKSELKFFESLQKSNQIIQLESQEGIQSGKKEIHSVQQQDPNAMNKNFPEPGDIGNLQDSELNISNSLNNDSKTLTSNQIDIQDHNTCILEAQSKEMKFMSEQSADRHQDDEISDYPLSKKLNLDTNLDDANTTQVEKDNLAERVPSDRNYKEEESKPVLQQPAEETYMESKGDEIPNFVEPTEVEWADFEKETVENHPKLEFHIIGLQNETATRILCKEEDVEIHQTVLVSQEFTSIEAKEAVYEKIQNFKIKLAIQVDRDNLTNEVKEIKTAEEEQKDGLKAKSQLGSGLDHKIQERIEINSAILGDQLQHEEDSKLEDNASTLTGTTNVALQIDSFLGTPVLEAVNKSGLNTNLQENLSSPVLSNAQKEANLANKTTLQKPDTVNTQKITSLMDNDDALLQMSPLQILKSINHKSMLDLVKTINTIQDDEEEIEKSSLHHLVQLTEQAESFTKLGLHEEAIKILLQAYPKICGLSFQNEEDTERKENLLLYCSNYLSVECFSLKNYEEALKWANNTLNSDPFNMQGLFKAYQCEKKLGRHESALLLIKKFRKLLCSPYAVIRSKYSMVEKLSFGDSNASSVTNPSASDSIGYQNEFDDAKSDKKFD